MDYMFSMIVIGLCGYAAISDWRSLTIPNIIPLALIGLFGVQLLVSSVLKASITSIDWPEIFNQLTMMGIIFAITFALFAARILGAGDAKLLTALAVWIPQGHVMDMMFVMAIAGAFLAAMALIFKKNQPMLGAILRTCPAAICPASSWLVQLSHGRNAIPYGVAIFAGMLWAVQAAL